MQKISPFLWFDNNAEDAMSTYASVFQDAQILEQTHMENQGPEGNSDLMLGTFQVGGLDIMVMNAGPMFTINPAVSFFVGCETSEQLTAIWNQLTEGGQVLMELGTYPFSEQYGWVQDRFNVSWQLFLSKEPQSATPCLLFVGDQFGNAEEAMNLYISLFKGASLGEVSRGEKNEINYAAFTLAGQDFIAMESDLDHPFTFTEATSFYIDCEDQAEVDFFWENLIANGGEPSQCGWLKDKFGVSWQVVPRRLTELSQDPDQEKVARVTRALLQMSKIDVAELERVYAGS